jgi:hypothetical protein
VSVANYEWTGTDASGNEAAGGWKMASVHLPTVIADRHKRGWTSLTVKLDGKVEGGIGPDKDAPGELTWWPQPKPAAPDYEARWGALRTRVRATQMVYQQALEHPQSERKEAIAAGYVDALGVVLADMDELEASDA